MNPSNYQSFLNTHGGVNPVAPPQGPQEGWFSKLLPTVGSIGGGILGGLVDPLGGEIAGAAGGSALGKELEGLLSGHQASLGELGTSALEGGIGQGVGMGLGKLGGMALGKVASMGDEAASNAAFSDPFSSVFDSAVGKKNNIAQVMPWMKNLNVAGDPNEFLKTAGAATGNTEKNLALITQKMNNATSDAGPIVGGDLGGKVAQAIDTGSLSPKDATWLNKQLDNITSSVSVDPEGNTIAGALKGTPGAQIGQAVDSGGLFKLVQSLDNKISPYYKQGVDLSVEDANQLNTLENVKGLLEDHLYNNGNIDEAVKGMQVSPDEYQQLLTATGGNKTVADDIASRINSSQTGRQLRAAQTPYVNASKIGQLAKFNNQGVNSLEVAPDKLAQHFQVLGQAAMGGPGGKLGAVANVASKYATPVIKTLAGIGKNVSEAGGNIVPIGAAQFVAHGPNYTPESTLNNAAGAPMNAPNNPANPDLNAVSIANELNNMIKVNPYLANSLAPVIASLIPQVQKTNAANAALEGYQGTLGAAGGPQGPAGGLMAQLSGVFNGGPAAQVSPEQHQAAAAIANATGMSMEQALAALPGLIASQQGAQQGFGQAQGVLSSLGAGQ